MVCPLTLPLSPSFRLSPSLPVSPSFLLSSPLSLSPLLICQTVADISQAGEGEEGALTGTRISLRCSGRGKGEQAGGEGTGRSMRGGFEDEIAGRGVFI